MPDPAQSDGLPALTSLVRECSIAGVPRRALLFRADLLPPKMARAHHLRLAEDALEPLLGAERARRFQLSHGRVAISWRGDAAARLDQALDGLEHLLIDAPMDAPAVSELARIFDLPSDGAALLALAADLSVTQREVHAAAGRLPQPPPTPLAPLDPALLDAIEEQLSNADVARFARRGKICRMGVSRFATAWERRVISIDELVAELAPGRNPHADRWLLLRLTRMLDRRMLAMLSMPAELQGAGPFSLDLNASGILSPEFLRFDAALPVGLRGRVVVNLHAADIMADLPAYRFARAFARFRDYRLLLRGVTPAFLLVLDLAALELDFVELQWSPALTALDPTALRAGAARWLLAGAHDAAALQWGQSAGIGLFEGRAVHAEAEHDLVGKAASVTG